MFADLKLFDIKETLETDGELLRFVAPEIVTVSCAAGAAAMKAPKSQLQESEVIGVSVLTSFDDEDSKAVFTVPTLEAMLKLSSLAIDDANLDGLVSSPKEAATLRERFGLLVSINTPAIRPEWSLVENDDQNKDRIMTPAKAIASGADRIVIGRPITRATNPRDAVLRTLDELSEAALPLPS